MESNTFPNGRHRNKTYQYVFENDKEFCEMVIKGEKSPFIPEDFFNFLLTKIEHFPLQCSISVQTEKEFVDAMCGEMRSQFRDVIGKCDVQMEQIHSPTIIELSNGFLGVFYRFFVNKHVANITNVDGRCRYLESFAAIFPFPVSDQVVRQHIDVLNFIDDELLAEMQTYLNEHFDDVEIRSVCRTFFSNIMNSKQRNVPENAVSADVIGIDLKGTGDRKFNDNFCFSNRRCEYLKSYPRVNNSGVSRYRKIYDMIVDVTKLYGKPCNVQAFKYEKNYLQKLPEINFYELYSLLNVDFLRSDRCEYVYRFKKYLFFFINALNHSSKPVFFIDDGLYECLLHYNTFKKSRNDVERLKFEISMLTLVYRRQQGFDVHRGNFCLDDDNLRNVKNYFDNYPGISNALVMHEIKTEVLECDAFVSTDRIVMDICFRSKFAILWQQFFEMIFYGAVSPNNIERLVVYNAFVGQEMSIAMPSNKQAIIEFVRKHNKYDFSQTVPPERFIILEQERYYHGDVSKWDSKRNFRF